MTTTTNTTNSSPPRIGRRALSLIAGIAGLGVVLLALGVYLDYRSFDQTSGGYEPPYTDWTGKRIDWSAAERTDDGFRQRGRVISSRLDCTSGMITFEVAGLRIDFREVSPRAIAVHQPREACLAAGFDPQF